MNTTSKMIRFSITLLFTIANLCIGLRAQVVWPGDINNNGTVNGVDVLYWGVAFGATGPSRAEISEEWEAFPLPNLWNQNFPDGLNYAYADCNGDGVVDESDFEDVIEGNYGEIRGQVFSDDFVNAAANSSAPMLRLETSTPVVLPGAAVNIDLSFANSDQSVENFYGIAFSLKYGSALLEEEEIDFDLAENNWIEADGSLVQDLFEEDEDQGTAMLAITRTNQRAIPIRESTIGSFTIVIEDIILGLERDTFTLEIDSVRLISDQFRTIPVVTDKIDIIVTTDTTSVKDTTNVISSTDREQVKVENAIKIYPNPVENEFFIQASNKIHGIRLYDQMGRMVPVDHRAQGNNIYVVRCGTLVPGIYWVRMRQANRLITQKVIYLTKT